jgi:Undecaprenyl-phosphate galactose phosphotransferase WbaP
LKPHEIQLDGGSAAQAWPRCPITAADALGTPSWAAPLRVAMLVLSDAAAIFSAAAAAYLLWAGTIQGQPVDLYLRLAPLMILFPVSYFAAGLYPGFGLGAVETLRRLFNCTTASFVSLAAVGFVSAQAPLYSRASFAIAWALASVLVPLFRFSLLAAAVELQWWKEPSLVVGSAEQARRTIASVGHAFSLGYRIVGVLLRPGEHRIDAVAGVPVLGSVDSARDFGRLGVSTALVWDDPAAPMLSMLEPFERVVAIRSDEFAMEQVRVRNLGGVIGFEFSNEALGPLSQAVKRVADAIFAAAGLLVAAPLMVVCGLAVKLISPGPMFFVQERGGRGQRPIRVVKLRTMRPGAESQLNEMMSRNPEWGRQFAASVKLDNDPRVLPFIGNWLRRFSVDELPQLWNVLKGDMSLVGPRPFPAYHLAMMPPEFVKLRSSVRPGLTGMWQVMARSDATLGEQQRLDTYYLRNWSPWLDLYLIARTVFAVLDGRGAR